MSEQENSSSNPPSAESQNSQKSIDAEPPGVKATFSPCILQCPKQGRMSGFAENSIKRMLDPPLVVEACPQVELSEPDKELLASTMLCQVTLYHESKDIPLAYLMNPDSSLGDQRFPYSINLLGEKIQTCFYMPIDHQDEKKHYIFVFTGLSIRCPGRYRFLCSILDTTTYFSIYENMFYRLVDSNAILLFLKYLNCILQPTFLEFLVCFA